MYEELDLKKDYTKYILYSVIKLKNKYGFRIKLYFSDGTDDMVQIGGFDKKGQASKERDKVAEELRNHTFVIYKKIKFEKYIKYWFYSVMKSKLKYNSYLSYRNIVENYAVPFFGNLYMTQINRGHIQKFYNQTSDKYKSIAKLAKTVMESAMQYAKIKHIIKEDPTININLPKTVEQGEYKTLIIKKEKILTLEQVKILIEASKSTPIYLQVLFAVLMGLRKQEINGLKYTDIDYVNRKLYLTRQLGRKVEDTINDCPKKMLTKQEIKLKSYCSERILDIPDLVFEAILEQKKIYEKNKKRRINDKNNPFLDEKYICCSTYGKPRSKGFHRSYYIKLLEDNKLPIIGFHDLRHTYATLLLINNYDLKAISQLLGHASTIITSNIYFDKNQVVIDCVEEVKDYIERVRPKDNEEDRIINEVIIENLDTNFMVNKYLT